MGEQQSLLLNVCNRIKPISLDHDHVSSSLVTKISLMLNGFCASSSLKGNTPPQIYLASEVGSHPFILGSRISADLLRLL